MTLAITPMPAPALTVVASNDHRMLAADWAADLSARVAAGFLAVRTAEAYNANIAIWLRWMQDESVAVPTPAHVLAFVAHQRKGHAPATVNARLAAVKALYTWSESLNRYPSIARSIRGLKVYKDGPLEALRPEQVAALLSLVDGNELARLRDRALIHVLFSTGLRLVSLTAADVGDFDVMDATTLVYSGKGDRGTKSRRAYLSLSANEALRHYLNARRAGNAEELPQDAPLFAAVGNRAEGCRLSARSIRRIVDGLMERAGHISRNEVGHISRPRIFSCHSLRRSAITAAFDCAGLEAAQTLAGHADPKTTMRDYARSNKARVLSKLAGVLDLGVVAAGQAVKDP